jgi:CheY-like chemotaxis protein
MQKWLIVDDDADDRDIFEVALQEAAPNVHLIQATNGLEALRLLKSLKPVDFPEKIFMDINMPNLDGKECIREIKKDPELRNIEVIMYTTSSADREKDACMKLGASAYVTKPTDISDLITILKGISSASVRQPK